MWLFYEFFSWVFLNWLKKTSTKIKFTLYFTFTLLNLLLTSQLKNSNQTPPWEYFFHKDPFSLVWLSKTLILCWIRILLRSKYIWGITLKVCRMRKKGFCWGARLWLFYLGVCKNRIGPNGPTRPNRNIGVFSIFINVTVRSGPKFSGPILIGPVFDSSYK